MSLSFKDPRCSLLVSHQTVSNNHSAIEELAIQFSRRLDLVNDALIKARSEGAEQRISKFAGCDPMRALNDHISYHSPEF